MAIAATIPTGGTGLKANRTLEMIAQMLAAMSKPLLRVRKSWAVATVPF
jgi:hypothetical protein